MDAKHAKYLSKKINYIHFGRYHLEKNWEGKEYVDVTGKIDKYEEKKLLDIW